MRNLIVFYFLCVAKFYFNITKSVAGFWWFRFINHEAFNPNLSRSTIEVNAFKAFDWNSGKSIFPRVLFNERLEILGPWRLSALITNGYDTIEIMLYLSEEDYLKVKYFPLWIIARQAQYAASHFCNTNKISSPKDFKIKNYGEELISWVIR